MDWHFLFSCKTILERVHTCQILDLRLREVAIRPMKKTTVRGRRGTRGEEGGDYRLPSDPGEAGEMEMEVEGVIFNVITLIRDIYGTILIREHAGTEG